MRFIWNNKTYALLARQPFEETCSAIMACESGETGKNGFIRWYYVEHVPPGAIFHHIYLADWKVFLQESVKQKCRPSSVGMYVGHYIFKEVVKLITSPA